MPTFHNVIMVMTFMEKTENATSLGANLPHILFVEKVGGVEVVAVRQPQRSGTVNERLYVLSLHATRACVDQSMDRVRCTPRERASISRSIGFLKSPVRGRLATGQPPSMSLLPD
jgi:hypothetical protein